ncbi:Vacuolar segregation protein pep7 [Neolecta irregularis DAH-3]|uniref:Vacuolar segregation protein pep7 n=1 Tax=Neolecta irregularis (strain DAH-3) TaxID=1198029 RepID=A0A1U7LRP3_NEOID|nr:Vacuolar segregation protein pep7 [Neolecta irregularis DAH-3]|eukprot:OLL25327.1 Vacuolar segregation protein pep7 [Neolecta irregularis DAH-3]
MQTRVIGRKTPLQPVRLSATEDIEPNLVCPICSETMIAFSQLNQHLDDVHSEYADIVHQVGIKAWLKQRVSKARNLAPVAAIHQKLGLPEPFERNGEISFESSLLETSRDSDDMITRAHWQPESACDYCSDPMCKDFLNSRTGKINCRKCGRLYCNVHTFFQIKLSRSASHEPVRGVWARVCEGCFKSRQGYLDNSGSSRDHTEAFKCIRQVGVEKQSMEANRHAKRLQKLVRLLIQPPTIELPSGVFRSIASMKSQRKMLEQSVVAWQENPSVLHCPFCNQMFSFILRKHHCRLCGRVVCADSSSRCSAEIGIDVADVLGDTASENNDVIDIRICRGCHGLTFGRSGLAHEDGDLSRLFRLYKNLNDFKTGIELLLPKFHQMVALLQDTENSPSELEISQASRIRKKLLDAFGNYDACAKRIKQLQTQGIAEHRIQDAIHQRATAFLQQHMLPLQMLPKTLRVQGISTPTSTSTQSPQIPFSTGISEKEETARREALMVLEEQIFLVQEMLHEANARRKYDEASILKDSLTELQQEAERLQTELDHLYGL